MARSSVPWAARATLPVLRREISMAQSRLHPARADTVSRPRTFAEAIRSATVSERFRQSPLSVRAAFFSAQAWLEPKTRSTLLTNVTATLARNWRNQAARERGWRHGNSVLRLVQLTIALFVAEGIITKNRVRNIPLLPPQWPKNDRSRRDIDALGERSRGRRNHPRANGAFGPARSAASYNSHVGNLDEPPIS